jgi:hypothetical protein
MDRKLMIKCTALLWSRSLIIINHPHEKAPSDKVATVIESLIEKQSALVNEIISTNGILKIKTATARNFPTQNILRR